MMYPYSTVDATGYSHFPVIARTGEVIGITYKQGVQHDYSHHTAVCLSQKPSAGGNQDLTLNGEYASGGVVTLPIPSVIDILSSGNDTGRIFTVYGLVDGVADYEEITGPAAHATRPSRGVKIFSIVTRISVNGNTAGNIRVGAFLVPMDVGYKYSTNGGATWSEYQPIFDGIADQKVYYYGVIGTRMDGSIIALASDVENPNLPWRMLRKISSDGKDWSGDAEEIVITGDVPNKCQFYGKIQRTPSGRLVVNGYDLTKTYVLWSDDGGLNWASKLLLPDGATMYSEVAIGIADELNWLAIVRVDGSSSSMVQLKTSDGGLNWTNQGNTNLPSSTGYKSPDLTTIYVDGTPYFVLTFMARMSGVPAHYIDSMCMIFGNTEDVLNSPAYWSRQFVVADSLETLSGYPSILVDPHSNVALMAYGKETSLYTAAQVATKSVNVAQFIADWKIQPYFAFRMGLDMAVSTPPMPPGAVGFGLLGFGSVGRTALFAWDTVGTYQIAFLAEGANAADIDATTGPLSGSTGSPGHITLSIDSNRRIHVENRVAPGVLTLALPRW